MALHGQTDQFTPGLTTKLDSWTVEFHPPICPVIPLLSPKQNRTKRQAAAPTLGSVHILRDERNTSYGGACPSLSSKTHDGGSIHTNRVLNNSLLVQPFSGLSKINLYTWGSTMRKYVIWLPLIYQGVLYKQS